MPKVVCSVCGNSVFAVTKGATLEIRGTTDFERCHTLSPSAEAGGGVDDPLECVEMEKAVEAALAAFGHGGRS